MEEVAEDINHKPTYIGAIVMASLVCLVTLVFTDMATSSLMKGK